MSVIILSIDIAAGWN